MSFLLVLVLILGILRRVLGNTWCHDESFIPDAVLRVTAENISQSCLPAKTTVLVNGTSPGPEIRLMEGKTYWIRVYNDMPDANLTMVGSIHWVSLSAPSTWQYLNFYPDMRSRAISPSPYHVDCLAPHKTWAIAT